MARRVFFSFHYDNDVWRANTDRNSWVTQGKEAAGFIDKAEFEKIRRTGDRAVKNWIDEQLIGTSVTVVLIGSETLDRPFVQYEIEASRRRGNAIIGVTIGGIKNQYQNTSQSQSKYTQINGVWFDEIIDGFYDYVSENGYSNMGIWIESAARKKGNKSNSILKGCN